MVSLAALKRKWDWTTAGESFTHWQIKQAIAMALGAAGVESYIEHDVSQGTGYALRVDVAVPSQLLAIEVQKGTSNKGYSQLKEERLARLGWRTVTIHVE